MKIVQMFPISRETPSKPLRDKRSGAVMIDEAAIALLVDEAIIQVNRGSQKGIDLLSTMPRHQLRKELRRRHKDLSRALGGLERARSIRAMLSSISAEERSLEAVQRQVRAAEGMCMDQRVRVRALRAALWVKACNEDSTSTPTG